MQTLQEGRVGIRHSGNNQFEFMKMFLGSLFMVLFGAGLCCAQEAIPVFRSGMEGYKTFRIPAIIRLPDGSLLAFAEGRVHDAGDYGNIDIVMKSSKDNGSSWSNLKVVIDASNLQAGNPAPVVDLTDPKFPKGRIFLFYNTGNNTEQEVRKGNGVREVWYVTSMDGGMNWSAPVNITPLVHKPKQPKFNKDYNHPEDWRSYANTPGHAMQMSSGKYRGRLVIPANHSAGAPKADFSDYQAHAFFSDDHGRSFRLSSDVSIPGSNESTGAQLPGGSLMMNSRNQRGDIKARIVSISTNGGSSWDTTYFDRQLPDPVCQGTLLNIRLKNGRQALAFCNAADSLQRNHLTLRISIDEGRTWPLSHLVDEGLDPKVDHTAYSDIIQLAPTTIGALYERDDYNEIVFKRVTITQ